MSTDTPAASLADLPLARRDEIARRLAAGQPVSAIALAAEFGLSEDAIRRDLRALAAEGRCRRVYGGALPVASATLPMAARMAEGRERKQALARAGVEGIAAGELLFLDNGSTNLALVDLLPDDLELSVATNSVDIAAAVLRRPELKLIVVGGAVDPAVGGCVDAGAVLAVSRMNIARCFVGACSVSAAGVSAFHLADATFKRALLEASREALVLATSDKLGSDAPHRVATLREIGTLVLEHDADARTVAALARAGAQLRRAPKPSTPAQG